MWRWLREASRRVFLIAMFLGWIAIAWASLPYFDPEVLAPFVIEKLPLRFEALWLASLKLHVASAALSFPLCLALMTRMLQRQPRLHRWLGRLTAACVLLALVPSGVVLAFDAKGGSWVTTGFLLSGAIVVACMVNGIRAARRRDLVSHGRAMRHVVAQMSVAVSSRALIVGLDSAGFDPEFSYVVALWVPVLGSAVVAELISRRPGVFSPFSTLHRIHRDVSSFALVRVRSLVRPVPRLGR
jgi:uncharacterized membrane protein